MGMNIELFAINHWEMAIETHAMNYPWANHICQSIENINPLIIIPKQRVKLLWASPECTHHSIALGGRPRCDQKRASAWLILKWLSELYVERLIIENVTEFMAWGPLGIDGKPIKSKIGYTFNAFINSLKSLGYKVEYRILCAADYGAPTTRRRLFIQAVRGCKRIIWPQPTHSEYPGLFAEKKWIPARDIIDWSISGKSIFGRKKPLVENTLRRIESGIKKYWGQFAEPFLIILRGTSNSQLNITHQRLDRPVPTISAGGIHACLIEPFIYASGHVSAKDRSTSINSPISTVVTKAEHCLVEPLIIHQMSAGRTRTVDEPCPTITTINGHSILRPFLVSYHGTDNTKNIEAPLDTIRTHDRFGIIEGDLSLDIRMRMLQPKELAAAQSFPDDYKFAGKKRDQVKQIGNAVPPVLARAITSSGMN
jgi:DNA (cytosine-5)-methyltransferase 1